MAFFSRKEPDLHGKPETLTDLGNIPLLRSFLFLFTETLFTLRVSFIRVYENLKCYMVNG